MNARPAGYFSDPYRCTFHRDRSVTLWNIYDQAWIRYRRVPSAAVMATLNDYERARIIRHVR